ncbi:MAG: HEAT repeat domain-containing protein [Planctomycetes bacterium]|nr:HEAT repeat domain-containing protein [Planctomycetota bacterium]
MKLMTTALTALILLAFVWQPIHTVSAADKVDHKALGKAWRKAVQALKDGDWPMEEEDGTLDRLSKLEGLLDYKTAIEMLEYFEECDTAWGSGATNRLGRKSKGKGDRPPEAYRVGAAILETVRTMEIAKEALKFASEGELENGEDFPVRVRMAMMDAITNNVDNEEVLKWVIEYAKDKTGDADIRILAVSCLDEVGDEEGVFQALMMCLTDRSWRIREVAVEAMAGVADNDKDRVIVVLIDRLAQEQGRLRKTIADALSDITGQDLGTNSDVWVKWFREKKRAEQGLPPKKEKPHRGSEVIFKTETFSNRYVFVLDTSVSMTKPMKPGEKENIQESMKQEDDDKREPLPWDQIRSLADLAREEIIRSLSAMDPEVTKFTVVAFDEEVKVWREELADANKKNIADAANWLRSIRGGKRTDVFGALDAVYDLCEKIAGADVSKRKKKKKKKKKNKREITGEKHLDDGLPDTVFMYTDGYATHGKYAGRDKEWQAKSLYRSEQAKLYAKMMNDMVVEVKDRNRIARLTINCIGVGERQDSRTMNKLSRGTGGKYRNITK